MMDPIVMAAAVLVVLSASFIQSLVGFGGGLVSVPVLLLVLPPKTVMPVMLLHGLITNLLVALSTRRKAEPKRIWPLFISGSLGIVPGMLILLYFDVWAIKLLAGALIISFTMLLFLGFRARLKNERAAMFPIGLVSGFMNGSLALSGPPVILFFSNQGMMRDRFRANLVTYFLVLNVITAISFLIAGLFNNDILLLTALFLPSLFLGAWLGIKLSGRVPENIFRGIALVIVGTAGGAAVISALGLI